MREPRPSEAPAFIRYERIESQQLANELYREWLTSTYQLENSELNHVLKHILNSLYDDKIAPDRNHFDDRDHEIIFPTDWEGDAFMITDEDEQGEWSLRPTINANEQTGKMIIQIVCEHKPVTLDKRGNVESAGAIDQTQRYEIHLQAHPDKVQLENQSRDVALKQRELEETAHRSFHDFAQHHLKERHNAAEVLAQYPEHTIGLDWALRFIPIDGSFEIQDGADAWTIIVYDKNGELIDINSEPKVKE